MNINEHLVALNDWRKHRSMFQLMFYCFSPSSQFKTLRVEEYQLALRNLEQHYQDFLRDSQDSQMFGAEERMQVEASYTRASQHHSAMVRSAEQGVCPLHNTNVPLNARFDDTFRLRLDLLPRSAVFSQSPVHRCSPRTSAPPRAG